MLPAAIATPYGKVVFSVAAPRAATAAVLRTSATSRPFTAAATSASTPPATSTSSTNGIAAGKPTSPQHAAISLTSPPPNQPAEYANEPMHERRDHRGDRRQLGPDPVEEVDADGDDRRRGGQRVGDPARANVGHRRCERRDQQHDRRGGHGYASLMSWYRARICDADERDRADAQRGDERDDHGVLAEALAAVVQQRAEHQKIARIA